MKWWLWMIYSLGSQIQTNIALVGQPLFNGRDAESEEYPFVVHISYHGVKRNHTCAGAIATLSRVISTGGCLGGMMRIQRKRVENFIIHGGSIYSHDTNQTQTRNLSKITAHPVYQEGTVTLYFVVGELKEAFVQSHNLAPFKLFYQNKAEYKRSWAQKVKKGANCSVIGWGFTRQEEESQVLKVVRFVPVPACVRSKNLTGEICLAKYVNVNDISDLVWNIASGVGMLIVCGDVVYGQMVPVIPVGQDTYALLPYWPHMELFYSSEALKSPDTTPETTEETNGGTEEDLWHISGCGIEAGSRLIFPVVLLPLIPRMPRTY